MLTNLPLVHRIPSALLALLFAWSAIMQANDPDPGWWIALYTLLAVVCTVAALWRVVVPLAAVIGAVALVWSLTLFPGVIELFTEHPAGDLLTGMSPDRPYVEEARESLGALIGAVAMAYLLILAWRARKAG